MITPAAANGHSPIRVPGTYNLRDAGGYPATDGQLRWGKLFRSDGLHRLTAEGQEMLRDLRIGLVVDLRDTSEQGRDPSRLDGVGAEVVNAPIFEGADPQTMATADVTLAGIYDSIIDSFGANVVRAIELIARSADTPVLVHCTAGKDRTGLVIALAQLAAGVSRRDVVADYAATEENLRGEWVETIRGQMLAHGIPDSAELNTIMSASPPELLETLLDRIDREHGSAAEYLLAEGLSADDLQALRLTLIRDTTTDISATDNSATDTSEENAA
ncbi:protein-tyrosine phosphatase [Microterricola gilva]|uniref:Protein-tyrosine phosphatase n=2 Tax=Microterricola gilva TaxID=393267 RepID=A0A4Q8APY1_9MICO|nr:protein-tyrosine phosphatase [Microterricola gilva]